VTETLETKPETATAPAPAPGRLILGVPKEIHPGERRVAVVPRMAAKLAKLGFDVVVESGPGSWPPSPTRPTKKPARGSSPTRPRSGERPTSCSRCESPR